jgi:proline iminopeptidase
MKPSSLRRSLYPPLQPYQSGFLNVSNLHKIYYEQCGNPNGKPAVVLHGGPGGGLVDWYRQFFNPDKYRIVLFDQRGAGKSEPAAELEENTTWDLVRDIEKIRELLGVDKWVVFGGSWGSTLALAYAQAHPERVKALVLRGIFTLRRKELLWFYQEGASFIFPDAFEKFKSAIPEREHGDLMSAYHRRLTGSNMEEKLKAARAWSIWEMSTSRLFVDPQTISKAEDDDDFCMKFARIESHYFVNGGWFEHDGFLIDRADSLNGIPGVIVQGRYDVVCPMFSAWDLSQRWKSGRLEVIPDAGHSAKEEGIIDALVRATDEFADL